MKSMESSPKKIRILRLSSRESPDALTARMATLGEWFEGISFEDVTPAPQWPYTAGHASERLACLNRALHDDTAVIWCARGGYGSSDLLSGVDFAALKSRAPKLIVGFSDVSALHSAFYTLLKWPGLHAPMPATTLWGKQGQEDLQAVRRVLQGDWQGQLQLRDAVAHPISGPLFGGCFSVLTNLIGTPYFPPSLANHILFFEDTGESPGRLMRFLNQWSHSGALAGVRAIVLGHFRECGPPEQFDEHIRNQFALRTGLPVFTTTQFGHCSPNFPIMVGATGKLHGRKLSWVYGQGEPLWA